MRETGTRATSRFRDTRAKIGEAIAKADLKWSRFIEKHAVAIFAGIIILALAVTTSAAVFAMKVASDAALAITALQIKTIELEQAHQEQRDAVKVIRIQGNTNAARLDAQRDMLKWVMGDEWPEKPAEKIWFTVTSYTCNDGEKTPGHPAYCITAPDPKTGKGHRLTEQDSWRVVAADPKYYPAGTKIKLEGIGTVTVRDTGGYIKGPNRLDIFAGETNIAAATRWGAKKIAGSVVQQ